MLAIKSQKGLPPWFMLLALALVLVLGLVLVLEFDMFVDEKRKM